MAPTLSTLRSLKAGDIVLEAKPMIHVVYVSLKGKHCDNCLTRRSSLKRCSKCHRMYYCNKNCQRIDWMYHKHECKVFCQRNLKPFPTSDNELLLFRLWLCLKSDDTFATNKFSLLDGSEICFKDIMEDRESMKHLIDMVNKSEEVVEVVLGLFACGLEFEGEEPAQVHRLLAIIKSPICQSFNWCPSETENEVVHNVGIGLFPQLMSVNHSCLPNSAIVTKGMQNIFSFVYC